MLYDPKEEELVKDSDTSAISPVKQATIIGQKIDQEDVEETKPVEEAFFNDLKSAVS